MTAAARLFCKWGSLRGAEFRIGDEATIGRAGDNTVALEDRSVSARHARIVFEPESDAYYLEDLGSLNGTRIDGVTVSGRERLERLHVVAFGVGCEFIFLRLPGEAAAAAAPEGTRVDREMPPLPSGLRTPGDSGQTVVDRLPVPLPPELAQRSGGTATLCLEIGPPGGRVTRMEIGEGEHLLGRGGNVDVVLDADDVSRRHAVLTVTAARVELRDLGSRNHTFVDERRIDGEVELQLPARLRFASLEARLTRAGEGE